VTINENLDATTEQKLPTEAGSQSHWIGFTLDMVLEAKNPFFINISKTVRVRQNLFKILTGGVGIEGYFENYIPLAPLKYKCDN
jgi:hypothetical protein